MTDNASPRSKYDTISATVRLCRLKVDVEPVCTDAGYKGDYHAPRWAYYMMTSLCFMRVDKDSLARVRFPRNYQPSPPQVARGGPLRLPTNPAWSVLATQSRLPGGAGPANREDS